MTSPKTIAIIGAGPIGLAAAAHALERGLQPIVLEQGPSVGHAVRQWGHVPMFSQWQLNVDAAAACLLAAAGWNRPDPEAYPTGADLVSHYLEPLAQRTALKNAIHLNAAVRSVGRKGFDKVKTAGREHQPFEITVSNGAGDKRILADAVIDASGTWGSPNPGGSSGVPARGEAEAHTYLRHGMPDVRGMERLRYAGKKVAVLGGGHSAIGTLIELARLAEDVPATEVVWLYRGQNIAKAFGGGEADQLAARGALGREIAGLLERKKLRLETGFRLAAIESTGTGLLLRAEDSRLIGVDELIVATGFRPDLAMLRELRVSLDPAVECPPTLAPLIDPNEHSCGTVRPHGAAELTHPEKGFYIAGMKSYGRAPTFLLATGHEQVRSIVAEIAGDHEAARRVELVLPETGVCAGSGLIEKPAEAGCCGGPAVANANACCVADEQAKAAGEAGCGCGSPKAKPVATALQSGCCG